MYTDRIFSNAGPVLQVQSMDGRHTYFDAVCAVPVRFPDVHSVTVVLPFEIHCTALSQ